MNAGSVRVGCVGEKWSVNGGGEMWEGEWHPHPHQHIHPPWFSKPWDVRGYRIWWLESGVANGGSVVGMGYESLVCVGGG